MSSTITEVESAIVEEEIVQEQTAVRTKKRPVPSAKRTLKPVSKAAASEAKAEAEAKEAKPRKKRTVKPMIRAMRKVRKAQQETDYQTQKAPFLRYLRQIGTFIASNDDLPTFASAGAPRVSGEAAAMLRTFCEAYMVQMLGDANRLAKHAKRVTAQPADVELAALFQSVPLTAPEISQGYQLLNGKNPLGGEY